MKKRILSLFFLSGIIFPYEGPAQKVEFLDGLPSIPYDYSYRMDISPKMKIVRDTLYVHGHGIRGIGFPQLRSPREPLDGCRFELGRTLL